MAANNASSIARRSLNLLASHSSPRGSPSVVLQSRQLSGLLRTRLGHYVEPSSLKPSPSCLTVGPSRMGWGIVHRDMSSGSGGGNVADDESDEDFKPRRQAISGDEDAIAELLKKQVTDNKVMLYMKGTPSEPRCGFSATVVRILHTEGVSFSSVNVLDYPAIREGVKKFSDWPTVPQLYVAGEFVGGCDILVQEHQSGNLATLFKEAGVFDKEGK